MKQWFSLSDSDYSDDHKPKITNLVAEGYLSSVFTFPPKSVPRNLGSTGLYSSAERVEMRPTLARLGQ